MDRNLALEFVRATESAAIASSLQVGRGDKHKADDVAVKQLRSRLNALEFNGKVIIGEGEKDEAPMLFIGEKIGTGKGIELEIAVDPLDGTDPAAEGGYGASSMIALGPKNAFMHAPDGYIDSIAVGSEVGKKIDLDNEVEENIRIIADCLGKKKSELNIALLDRERNKEKIKKIRAAGARTKLIMNCDTWEAIAAALPDYEVDALMGIGATTEAVLTATALKCLNGNIQGKLFFANDAQRKKAEKMNARFDKLELNDLCKTSEASFVATGVTNGTVLKGVRFTGQKIITHSVVMRCSSKTIRFIEGIHDESILKHMVMK
ncbi:class II fructose-bisphosphatase [Candidatus Micrarchaeota archaeon]|nr:class II fructose-bisphosphatase [Candidatus Micrarchaeota archaeon]